MKKTILFILSVTFLVNSVFAGTCGLPPLNPCWSGPHVDILSPLEGEFYNHSDISVEVISTQEIAFWGYILNGGNYKTFEPNKVMNFPLGENLLIVYGSNENGTGRDYVKFYVGSDYVSICGNGLLETHEECDDGNLINGDGCSSECLIEEEAVCGNGILEPGEECDDGNLINGDGCSSLCTIEENISDCDYDAAVRYSYSNSYGLGIAIRPEGGEWIEESLANLGEGIYEIKYIIDNKNEEPITDLNVKLKINQEVLENYLVSINSYTSKTVLLNSSNFCGLSTLYLEVDSERDCYPEDNYASRSIYVNCSGGPDYFCGNGVLEPGEECDAGNSNGLECSPSYSSSCNYCSASCTLETITGAYCGDGICQNPYENFETCSEDCEQEICIPDWEVGEWSECMDNSQTRTVLDLNNCDNDTNKPIDSRFCIPPECINGEVKSCNTGLLGICSSGTQTCGNNVWGECIQNNFPTIEICNDLDDDCDGLIDEDNVCYVPECGNGILDQGEQCDDGNVIMGDGCSLTCQIEEPCVSDWSYGQWSECIGNSQTRIITDLNSCEDSYTESRFCFISECGNGILDTNEQCDYGLLNGILCSAGYGGSCEYCSTSCILETITGAYCGDGICNGEENYESCTSDCQKISICGDERLDLNEQCDQGILNGFLCSAEYGESCEYCTSNCKIGINRGLYCGDGICSSEENENTCSIDCSNEPEEDSERSCEECCCGSNYIDYGFPSKKVVFLSGEVEETPLIISSQLNEKESPFWIVLIIIFTILLFLLLILILFLLIKRR